MLGMTTISRRASKSPSSPSTSTPSACSRPITSAATSPGRAGELRSGSSASPLRGDPARPDSRILNPSVRARWSAPPLGAGAGSPAGRWAASTLRGRRRRRRVEVEPPAPQLEQRPLQAAAEGGQLVGGARERAARARAGARSRVLEVAQAPGEHVGRARRRPRAPARRSAAARAISSRTISSDQRSPIWSRAQARLHGWSYSRRPIWR